MKTKTYIDILETDHKRVKALFKKFEHTESAKAKKIDAEAITARLIAKKKELMAKE